MGDNINLQEIRERILSEDYGKFDLIEEILARQEILDLRPRIIFKRITERLSIPEDKINRNTFWSWLRRYRKIYGRINPKEGIAQGTLIQEPGNTREQKVTDLDWLENFKPSEPENTGIRPVVIKVIRSERNSQK